MGNENSSLHDYEKSSNNNNEPFYDHGIDQQNQGGAKMKAFLKAKASGLTNNNNNGVGPSDGGAAIANNHPNFTMNHSSTSDHHNAFQGNGMNMNNMNRNTAHKQIIQRAKEQKQKLQQKFQRHQSQRLQQQHQHQHQQHGGVYTNGTTSQQNQQQQQHHVQNHYSGKKQYKRNHDEQQFNFMFASADGGRMDQYQHHNDSHHTFSYQQQQHQQQQHQHQQQSNPKKQQQPQLAHTQYIMKSNPNDETEWENAWEEDDESDDDDVDDNNKNNNDSLGPAIQGKPGTSTTNSDSKSINMNNHHHNGAANQILRPTMDGAHSSSIATTMNSSNTFMEQQQQQQQRNNNNSSTRASAITPLKRGGRSNSSKNVRNVIETGENGVKWDKESHEKPNITMFLPILRVLGKGSFGKVRYQRHNDNRKVFYLVHVDLLVLAVLPIVLQLSLHSFSGRPGTKTIRTGKRWIICNENATKDASTQTWSNRTNKNRTKSLSQS